MFIFAAGSTWWLVCSAVCVVCAMLSKEQGITGVGVCVVYDYITFIQVRSYYYYAVYITKTNVCSGTSLIWTPMGKK